MIAAAVTTATASGADPSMIAGQREDRDQHQREGQAGQRADAAPARQRQHAEGEEHGQGEQRRAAVEVLEGVLLARGAGAA